MQDGGEKCGGTRVFNGVAGEVRVSRSKGYAWKTVNVWRRKPKIRNVIYLWIPVVAELEDTCLD